MVEKGAAELFRDHGHAEIADSSPASAEAFAALWYAHDVLVAVDPQESPVGFAVSPELDGFLHLAELSVDPNHGRIGLGSAPVDAAYRLARDRALAWRRNANSDGSLLLSGRQRN